jgi:hypothetical protein
LQEKHALGHAAEQANVRLERRGKIVVAVPKRLLPFNTKEIFKIKS